jgi:hypothetical protein
MQLTTIKMVIYQVQYTCDLYFNFCLDQQFRGDVALKKNLCRILSVNKKNVLLFLFFYFFLPHKDISVFHTFGEGVAIAK